MNKINVFIADDHALFRQGIIGALQSEPGFIITGEAESLEQLMTSRVLNETDILTLDISFNDKSSLDSIKTIINKYPKLNILIISMHNKPILIKHAVNLGASGYFLKSSPPERLKLALKEIFKGNKYLDPALSDSIFTLLYENTHPSDSDSLYNSLSNREQEIFRLLAEGLKPLIISRQLNISRKTVENHRSNIMHKLKLNSIGELIQLAEKLGVI